MLSQTRFVPALFLGLATVLSACTVEEDLGRRSDSGTTKDNTSGGTSTTDSDGGTSRSRGTCKGTPDACDPLTDQTSCTKRGCTYAPRTCTGTAKSCSEMSQALCDYVPGCNWQPFLGSYACVGRPVACDERGITGNCDAVMGKSGCTNEGGCSGAPKACETFTMDECTRQGCEFSFE